MQAGENTMNTAILPTATLTAAGIRLLLENLTTEKAARGGGMRVPPACKLVARMTGATRLERHIVTAGVFEGCCWREKWATPAGVEFGWAETGTAAWDGPAFWVRG